jgi:CRISPR-associated endonuclease Cas3-HD
MIYYAHSSRDGGCWEKLETHLNNVAARCAEFCREFNLYELGANSGYLHDIGKYQNSFQKRINGSNIRVEHAVCGAKEAFDIFTNPLDILNRQIIAYAVAGHHSGLPDCGTEADNETMPTLAAKLKRPTEDFSAYRDGFAAVDIPPYLKNFDYTHTEKPFALSFIIRMLFALRHLLRNGQRRISRRKTEVPHE